MDMISGLRNAAAAMGYTSLQEFPVGLEYRRYIRILDAADLHVRWRAACFPLGVNESCDGGARNPLIDPSGIKWIADGTPIERLAALHREYLDDPGNLATTSPRGLSRTSSNEVIQPRGESIRS